MNWIFSVVVFSIVSPVLSTYAQTDSSGIYLSGQDFKNNKMAYAINCKSESHKIKLNDFFAKPYITVIHNDSSYKLSKAKIFGYKTCDGQIIRFLGKKELVLVNPTESILIYRHDVVHPAKGKTNVTNYYFSKDAVSAVEALTLKNVKKAFADNHSFHEKIDASFKYNTELAEYDGFHKIYKLNWILKNSQPN